MEIFEYIETTPACDKDNDDEQRVKVFWLNPFLMESFDTCNIQVLWIERKFVGQPRKKPVFMPMISFSWELSHDGDSLLSYLENQMTNPGQLTIKTHRKN